MTTVPLSSLIAAIDHATNGCTCDPDMAIHGEIVEVLHDHDCPRAARGTQIASVTTG